MAIPASGSVSLSQIQTEWGGSAPTSISEYYLGSLTNGTNATSVEENVSIGAQYASQTTPGNKFVASYTTYYANNGWVNSNIFNSTYSSALGASSQNFSRTINADNQSNAGTIPNSGAISFNHFRSTAKGTTSTITCYGWYSAQSSGGLTGAAVVGYMYVFIAGHYGGASEGGPAGGAWTGVPFRYLNTSAEGSSVQMPATTWYGSDTNSSNGANNSQWTKTHRTYPSIGNVTEFVWRLNSSSSFYRNFSGTVNMIFKFS